MFEGFEPEGAHGTGSTVPSENEGDGMPEGEHGGGNDGQAESGQVPEGPVSTGDEMEGNGMDAEAPAAPTVANGAAEAASAETSSATSPGPRPSEGSSILTGSRQTSLSHWLL